MASSQYWIKLTTWAVLASHWAFASSASSAVLIRDSQTGHAIASHIREWMLPESVMTPAVRTAIKRGTSLQKVLASKKQLPAQMHMIESTSGRVDWHGSDQWRVWQINAAGYAPMQALIEPGEAVRLTTIWLDPSPGKSAAPCPQESVCGFVNDQQTGQPIGGARVTFRAGQQQWLAQSDNRGYFILQPKGTKAVASSVGTLHVSYSGYRQQAWQAVEWQPGVQFLIDLSHGTGTEKHSLKNPLADVPSGHVPLPWLQVKLSQLPSQKNPASSAATSREASEKRAQTPSERPGGAIFMDPPDSITVGFAADGSYCCGNNCTTSQVFSLETYVQKGLDNEWISSWGADSLKAGSVPFRSYGAWHAIESPYTGYDICAGPCCQAFGQTSYGSTVAAAQATAGILLELNGALARSEYSAENNAWNDPSDGLSCTNTDLSCGDGFVGSPSTGWPCLADDSAGRGCFGHGRGMSQWGTYYHDLNGENWAAIIDHYYNDAGNPGGQRSQYATTPVALLSFAPWPETLNAGDHLDIGLVIDNTAGSANSPLDFGPVLIGASLLTGTTDYSDPANDISVTVNTFGQQNLNRVFHTQTNWPPGNYDLAVALWLDTDGNSVITGEDWVLAFDVLPAAVTLLAPNDLIFADGF